MVIAMAVLLSSCSSTPQKAARDEYFRPVDQMVHQPGDSGAAPIVLTRERTAGTANKEMKDSVFEMIKEQNKRLDEVSRQLNAMTKGTESSTAARRDERLQERLSDRNQATYELLSEMMKDQNQRLNEIIGQLRVLLQNREPLSQNVTARTDTLSVQVQPAGPVSVPKRLAASLSYGRAIQLYQSRQYEKAMRAFGRILNRRGDPALAVKCRFWMGVCQFNLRMLNEALAAFKEVLKEGSEKAESACFMIGQCYERMGAKNLALETYEELLRQYPAGRMIQIARIKLALLR